MEKSIKDQSMSQIFSQGTNEVLQDEIAKTPGLAVICKEMCNDYVKRRTPKISSYSMPFPADDYKTVLNKSIDPFEDSSEPNEGSLMDQSFVSNATLTQITCFSQKVEYLRERTEEEQHKRNQERERRKSAPYEEVSVGQERKDFPPVSNVQQTPLRQTALNEDRDVFDDSVDLSEEVETSLHIEEDSGMSIEVLLEKTTKTSDLAYEVRGNTKYLWTKMKCDVPISLKWKVNSSYSDTRLSLKIRFIHHEKHIEIEDAIRDYSADVLKCVLHSERETQDPKQSFFHIHNIEYECNYVRKKGYQCVMELPPGTFEAEFDIVFACQEKCLEITDRRKTMCLVVFLCDENGNEILHTYIDQVRIVAYPRRDWKNFREKEDAKYDFKKPIDTNYGNRDLLESKPFLIQSKQMFTESNDIQMFPSTSANSRKRAASEYVPTVYGTTVTSQSDYARQLHGCAPKEPIDCGPENENSQSAFFKKKIRVPQYHFENLKLSKKEMSKVVEFLAVEARKPKRSWYPTPIASLLTLDEGLERYLTALNQRYNVDLFHQNSIFKMSDMIKEFERNENFLDRIGIDPSRIEEYYDIFLDFYRIQKAMKH